MFKNFLIAQKVVILTHCTKQAQQIRIKTIKQKKGRQKEHFFVCAINISESSKNNTSGGKLLGGKFQMNLGINFLMLKTLIQGLLTLLTPGNMYSFGIIAQNLRSKAKIIFSTM